MIGEEVKNSFSGSSSDDFDNANLLLLLSFVVSLFTLLFSVIFSSEISLDSVFSILSSKRFFFIDNFISLLILFYAFIIYDIIFIYLKYHYIK